MVTDLDSTTIEFSPRIEIATALPGYRDSVHVRTLQCWPDGLYSEQVHGWKSASSMSFVFEVFEELIVEEGF